MKGDMMKRILACCFALVLMYPVGIDFYLIGVKQIEASLYASPSEVHYAFAIYLMGMASTMIFAGALSDKVGRKPFAIIGSLIFIGACITAGSSVSIDEFLASRFFQGIGAGFCYVMCFSIIRDALPEDKRVKVLTVINGVTCSIPVLAPVIGSVILIWFSWESLFFIMAFLGLLPLILVSFFLKETRIRIQNNASQHHLNKSAENLLEFNFVSRLIISSLGVMSILTYVNVSPMILMTGLSFTINEYAIAMGLLSLMSMFTSFITPVLLKTYQQSHLIFTTQILYLFGAMITSLASMFDARILLTLLGMSCVCIGFALSFGILMSQAVHSFKHKAGLANSILAVSQIIVSSLFITLGAWLALTPENILIYALLFTATISTILLTYQHKTRQKGYRSYEQTA
ncbi:multidrug transporter MdtL [Shewanella sp. OPT22]|nr:multidrug transporter MdtL [Shewanella sp. OPT22]